MTRLPTSQPIPTGHAPPQEPARAASPTAPSRLARGSRPAPLESATAADHFRFGVECERTGALDDAIGAFARALTEPTLEFESRCWLGFCLRRAGRPGEATTELKAALYGGELTAEHKAWLYDELGACYEAQGDAAEALFFLEMAVKCATGDTEELGHRVARLRARVDSPHG